MPHTRLDRLTYTVHGTTETELIHQARHRLTAVVTDVEQWQLAIDAEPSGPDWAGTVVATRRPAAKPKEATT